MIINIENETKRQANALGLIRFFSAMAIVLFHYNKMTGGVHTDSLQPWYTVFKLAYVHGGTLVELFFIVSGFCFVLFYRDRIMRGEVEFRRFIIHRFGRVLPSYWLSTALIVTFGILSINTIGSTISNAGGSITDLKFLPLNILCLNFAHPVNGVAWFLAVNMICYIWYYLIYWIPKRYGDTRERISNESQSHDKNKACMSIISFIVSILGASACVYLLKGNPIQNIARGIASFGVGGGIAAINNRSIHSRRKRKIIVTISLLLLAISIYGLVNAQIFQENEWLIEVYLLFPSIVFLVTNLTMLRVFLSKPWTQKFGAYSYTIYIFQTAVMTIIYFLFGLAENYNWYSKENLIVYIIAIVAFGTTMYYVWDKPMGNRIKKMEEKIS